MSEPVLLSRAGAVATITLHRPEAGNTINMALAEGLARVLDEIVDDPAVRCVVLTGEGRLFCGGGDISAFAAAGDSTPQLLRELADAFHASVLRMAKMAKPLVVLVNGPAAGAGMSLALLGDVVLAARSAHFTAAYGMVGLTPDGGMSWLLPRLVGLRHAQEMILTNRRVGAEEAAGIGLISRVVDDADLVAAGQELAAALAEAATGALGGARALLSVSLHNPLDVQLDLEALTISAAGATADSREGISAFLARRKPKFTGER
ncbi:MAG: enoyl-CoA hydratase [Sphingomonadales bacterium]|nr:enoyl-CoA hydratase [Sphingomonadales bacterium]MBU3992526.1 enoyl-CoA hydratase/isomerase family protein [Alphaproteobacteria bacterium]